MEIYGPWQQQQVDSGGESSRKLGGRIPSAFAEGGAGHAEGLDTRRLSPS